MFEQNGKRDLGIYIHIPFCVRKCQYCDFLSFPADARTREAYVRQLLREIEGFPGRMEERDGADHGKRWTVPSIYLGGGTPSVLETGQICRILEAVRLHFPVEPDAEITLECNPGSDPDFPELLRAGVNRLSIGVQSADDEQLKRLGRIHRFQDAADTAAAARAAGFANLSIDLIFSLPGQSLQSWEETLKRTVELQPEHISAYSLIIEEGTPFYARYHEEDARRARGEMTRLLPDEETEREMYWKTEQVLAQHGYERYEISNYAKPGWRSVHNSGYWMRREYAGFGLGASSQTGDRRYKNTSRMEEYLAGDLRPREETILSAQDARSEAMFLGLRMKDGVQLAEFQKRYKTPAEEAWPGLIGELCRKGLLLHEGAGEEERILLTERGTDLSNYVFARFLNSSS